MARYLSRFLGPTISLLLRPDGRGAREEPTSSLSWEPLVNGFANLFWRMEVTCFPVMNPTNGDLYFTLLVLISFYFPRRMSQRSKPPQAGFAEREIKRGIMFLSHR